MYLIGCIISFATDVRFGCDKWGTIYSVDMRYDDGANTDTR